MRFMKVKIPMCSKFNCYSLKDYSKFLPKPSILLSVISLFNYIAPFNNHNNVFTAYM